MVMARPGHEIDPKVIMTTIPPERPAAVRDLSIES